MNWQGMDTAKKDGSMMMLFCPGISPDTKGILMGGWDARLAVWTLLPYGSAQPTTLYPSRWADIPAGPTS